MLLARCLALLVCLWLSTGGVATAAGPRWVTGGPYFTTGSLPVIWYTTSPVYYTDPSDLSPSVDHVAADALVAAAAGVWNVPTSSLVLAQGGQLAEHVSSQNVYLGSNGLVFPADVSSANYAAVQIAVIYDSDGSVTDLLLGQGASDPTNCQQEGVTESVDAISTGGTIQHALLIVNGRCTGAIAAQQLQLQYQLMRAFGRILGLGWSQVNDNVFTGSPAPTNEETVKWPIMHPIDIVCGPYTYQCLPYPFTLRPDDVASVSQLYFLAKGAAPAGKADTLANASAITGIMQFGDGQGMQGMNILVRRADPVTPYLENDPVVSAVSGNLFRWDNGNPVTGPVPDTVAASMGNANPAVEGSFKLGYIPLLSQAKAQDTYLTSEAINPLYTGPYGIGPYTNAPVTPSGPAFPWRDNNVQPYESNFYVWSVPGSASTCAASNLGSAAAPAAVAASGWWMDVLCGYGTSAWPLVTVQAGRSMTLEVTALDEQGLVTENKLQPLIGVWNLGDPTSALPTVAAASFPFNSIAAGLTQVNFDTPGAGPLRLVITDQRGDGRPDYNFRARVLYADSIAPAVTQAGGGLVTLTGMGFRAGLELTVGGATATVVSATATTILFLAPPFAALGAGSPLTVDVVVTDPMSGGSTAIYGGLTYPAAALSAQSPSLAVLTPTFYLAAGQAVGFIPEVSLSAAGAAAPGVPVTWTSQTGPITFAGGSQTISDANGIAEIVATVSSLGSGQTAVASACAWASVPTSVSTSICGSFLATGVDPTQWTLNVFEGSGQSVGAASVLQPAVFQVTDAAGDPVIGVPVSIYQEVTGWQVCPAQGRCPIPPVYKTSTGSAVSDANGLVVVAALQVAGTPEVTMITAAAGTQGYVSTALQKLP